MGTIKLTMRLIPKSLGRALAMISLLVLGCDNLGNPTMRQKPPQPSTDVGTGMPTDGGNMMMAGDSGNMMMPGDGGNMMMPGDGGGMDAEPYDSGFENPDDLTCLNFTPLRLWDTHFSAVALLFRIHTCAGSPVQLRNGSDYAILEDNVALSSEAVPTIIPTDHMRIYVSLLLDMSDSTTAVRGEIVAAAKQFVQTLVNNPALNVRIGIRLFDGRANVIDWQLPLEDAPRLLAKLDELVTYNDPSADGSATNLNGAMLQGVQDLRRWQERITDRNLGWSPTFGYTVVFTDGRDTAGRVDIQTASATVSAAREWENGTNDRPNVDTFGIALAGADYDALARQQFTTLLGGADYLEEGSASDLAQLFDRMATRILDSTQATHVLTYCSASRAGLHQVSVGINPSVGAARTPLDFDFDAEGFGPGCRQFVQSSCNGVQCGGFNCGACDDETQLCNGSNKQCDNECLLNEQCSSEIYTNALGYSVECTFPANIQSCSGDCVDLQITPAHCSTCDYDCPTGIDCAAGVCQCPGTNPAVCDENGTHICADLFDDPSHCGACGSACLRNEVCMGQMCNCPAGVTCGWFCSSLDCYAAIDISQGPTHSCAVLSSGNVICWGQNTQGQLGTGETANSNTPVRVVGINDATQVSVGSSFSCALHQSGSVSCWGSDASGRLGNSAVSTSTTIPVPVDGLTDAIQIDLGSAHACAVKQNGQVACWGEGGNYQQGNESTADNLVPDLVTSLNDALQVSAGSQHTCAVKQGGSVVCWGQGTNYRLGDGSLNVNERPNTVGSLTSAVQVSAGHQHSCAVTTSGAVECWGEGSNYRLGDNSTSDNSTARNVSNLNDAVWVEAGFTHSCALRQTGEVDCWGSGLDHRLGDGATTENRSPATVSNLNDAIALSGYNASCVIREGGAIECWGPNTNSLIGNGGTSTANTPEATTSPAPCFEPNIEVCGGQCVNILTDTQNCGTCGTTCAQGANCASGVCACPGTVPNICNDTCVNLANDSSNCGTCGTSCPTGITCSNSSCDCPTATPNVCGNACVSLASDGANCGTCGTACNTAAGNTCNSGTCGCLAAGGANCGWSCSASGCTDPIQIDAGEYHTCALQASGTVVCWGQGANGTLGNGALSGNQAQPQIVQDLADATQIAVGHAHACALTQTGNILCWGDNFHSQGGSVLDTFYASATPMQLPLSGVAQLVAGGYHTCARYNSGEVDCWGRNDFGQLGNNDNQESVVPVPVSGLTDAVEISPGEYHTCARRTNGSVVCWGNGGSGRLGDGNTSNNLVPNAVTNITNAVEISAGDQHTCARLSTGSVQCWGEGLNYRLGDGSTGDNTTPNNVTNLTDATAIETGGRHSCALKASGQLVCWGENGDGQIGNNSSSDRPSPTNVSGMTSVARFTLGFAHTCAVTTSGSVHCWGQSANNQTGISSTADQRTAVDVSYPETCPQAISGKCGAPSAICRDLSSDTQNCGGCGVVCPMGVACTNGTCACPMGTSLCDGACINTNTDTQNCGACRIICANGATCNNGSCTCPMGQTVCNGACVDLSTDANNCGTCGSACSISGELCSGGICAGCPVGQTVCNGACVNTNTDANNCGTCGTSCFSGESCSAGNCSCSNYTICSGNCVDTATDRDHCNACGSACMSNEICTNSQCVLASVSYTDGFEGTFPGAWTLNPGRWGSVARITTRSPRSGTYHVAMAQSGGINNPWVTNNMSICLDLSLAANLTLSVWAKEFADELHATDGVFLSAPGVSATKIISFVSDFSVYREFTTDLEAAITAAGITDRSRVTILLQQYDNAPLGNDGIAFDDFSVSGLGAITVCP